MTLAIVLAYIFIGWGLSIPTCMSILWPDTTYEQLFQRFLRALVIQIAWPYFVWRNDL